MDEIGLAMAEIARTLRPGGMLLATLPFLYPIHDEHDAWRVLPDGWAHLLGDDFDLEALVHFGGRVTAVALLLQRPVANWRTPRFIAYKLFGLAWVATMGWRDQIDASPVGYGIVARRGTAAGSDN